MSTTDLPVERTPDADEVPATGAGAPPDPAAETRADRARDRGTQPRSLLHYIGVSLSVVALVVVVAVATATIIVPKIAGATPLTVLTSSMEPRYPPGTLVIIRPVAAADIQVGDVITYQLRSGEPEVVTHRVIEKDFRQDGEIQLVTQGDNNAVPDQNPVREVQVRGRLWYAVPYLGWVNSWLGGGARQAALPVLAGLLIAYGAWTMLSGVREKRRKGRAGR